MSIFLFLIPLLFFAGFRTSNKFPMPLSPKEEAEYLKKFLEEHDDSAKDVLVERNLRLVANIAKKYVSPHTDIEDLISIGIIGLIKGINTYKIEKKSKLSTYVSTCIENEILMHLRHIKKYKDEVLLQDCVGQDKEGNELLIIDTLPADEKEMNEIVGDNIYLQKIQEIFTKILSEEEQFIIKKRYGIFGEERITQHEIAKILGISRSYVSRIETRALKKLTKELNGKN